MHLHRTATALTMNCAYTDGMIVFPRSKLRYLTAGAKKYSSRKILLSAGMGFSGASNWIRQSSSITYRHHTKRKEQPLLPPRKLLILPKKEISHWLDKNKKNEKTATIFCRGPDFGNGSLRTGSALLTVL